MNNTSPADSRLDAAVVLALIGLIAGILWVLAFVDIPQKNATLFAAIAGGVVGSGLTAYINYRWGASKGSAAKDETINALAKSAGQ